MEKPGLPLLYTITDHVVAKQIIPKTLIQEAVLNLPVSFWGTGAIRAQVEDQFINCTYPLPKEEGELKSISGDTDARQKILCPEWAEVLLKERPPQLDKGGIVL